MTDRQRGGDQGGTPPATIEQQRYGGPGERQSEPAQDSEPAPTPAPAPASEPAEEK